MSIEKFTPDELEIRKYMPAPFGPPTPMLSTPITPKENLLRLYQGKTPMWAPFSSGEVNFVMVDCDPENVARGRGDDHCKIDGWGVEWIFVDVVGGAMVKPGKPLVTDIDEWETQVKSIPDPDTWDWAGCYERTKDRLDPDRCTTIAQPGCLFERFIALMDFENAAIALIDEDQKEAAHRLLRTITDVHKKFYKNAFEWFHPTIMNFNDDWGSQRAEFFKEETVREMLLPYVKELCSYVHSLGCYWELHCCGFVEHFVKYFVEAGYDSWGGQPLNDKWKLKQLYGDKMIFTGHLHCPADATEAEQDAAVEKFFATIGADNRVLVEVNRDGPPGLRAKAYEASRRNYDRLKAEGKVIE